MRYIKAINGTIEAAIVEILFIPPIITRPTSMLNTKKSLQGLFQSLIQWYLRYYQFEAYFLIQKYLLIEKSKDRS